MADTGGIAIHGFGRIGRSALKAAPAGDLFVPLAIPDIKDLPLAQMQGDHMVSVAAWYDNEMGYATRLAEMARTLAMGG